jgi:anti-sigma factor RsiW
MTHPGQRLSALIDGELDGDERERVLGHLARCGWCRDEAAALRTLKRRMNALGEAAAGAALTGRLMDLTHEDSTGIWPSPAAAWSSESRPDSKVPRYFLGASVAVFLASLGTAAFIAGGDPQAQAPAPRVTPSVDVYLLEHSTMSGLDVRELAPPRTSGAAESPPSSQP